MAQKLPRLSPSVRNWQDLENQNWADHAVFLTHHHVKKGDNANFIYQRIRTHFKCQQNDIYLVTYPKEGTTWTCSILERLNQLEVDGKLLENDKVKINLGLSKGEIAPWLECLADGEDYLDNFRFLENKTGQRYIKSHSPITLIPNLDPKRSILQKSSEIENFKVISIIRNPLDQMVSHWHHTVGYKQFFEYDGSFEDFFEICLNPTNNSNNEYNCGGRLSQNGDWFLYHEEVLKFWVDNRESKSNKMILETYENLKKDDAENFIKNLVKFINLKSLSLQNDEYKSTCISQISKLCSFKSMKKVQKETGFSHESNLNPDATHKTGNKNEASAAHIREGKVGGWRDYYSQEMLDRWEVHVESKRESCPLMFEYLGKAYLCGETFETRLDFNYL